MAVKKLVNKNGIKTPKGIPSPKSVKSPYIPFPKMLKT